MDRIAAARLVPEMDLRRYLEARSPVEAWEVADEFGVDDATAARAMTMLNERRTA